MMELAPLWIYALDWLNLLLRWAHVVVAIAWVGSSFYFVWLDNSLISPADAGLKDKGVGGELWAVHGGGFYNPQKYVGAPPRLPANLHWFYWESYSTWLTGFALFTVLYLFNAGTFLVDRSLHNWSPMVASWASIGFLAGFWVLYDGACRLLGKRAHGDALLGAVVIAAVMLASWLACQLFPGRAAFLLVGAMMATAMSANVFFWIIPGQRAVVAAISAGQPADPVHGQRGKQRSVHNTYFVLPVLFAMLSNHYPWVYGHASNWLVLVLMMLAGALIRHFFVARHKTARDGLATPWHWAVASVALLLAVAVWLAPVVKRGSATTGGAAELVPLTEQDLFLRTQAVVQQRCVVCHNAQVAQKGVALHTPELVATYAAQIYQQVVLVRAMPFNNATRITQEERDLIGRWFQARP